MADVIILMGVSGCGKTTVGQALAEALEEPTADEALLLSINEDVESIVDIIVTMFK